MCGIVGYVGARQATPILVNGLRKLEYRGYDSAGVAVWHDGASRVVRCRGKLANLEDKLLKEPAPGTIGIGHTRWATHGRPSDENAHPHKVGTISVIHNGIIENHLALRGELAASGSKFTSETDTELFAHLVEREVRQGATDLTAAVRAALAKVHGAYAFVVMNDKDPSTLVAAKNASPMVVGLGEGENFIASDVTAILAETRRMIFVEEGEIVTLTRDAVTITDFDGKVKQREAKTITWSPMQAEKSGFKHYMLKEIHEQPRSVADTLVGRVDLEHDDVTLDGITLDPKTFKRIIFVACGTSYHASLVGEFMIEALSRIPVEVDLASEWRYRDPIVGPGDLVIAVSQSGETADTMAAVREAKAKGAKVLAISNVLESSIPRLADWAFYTHAGPEIGVASTKAFTTQLVAMALLALHLGRRTGTLTPVRARELLHELVALPQKMKDVADGGAQLQVVARRYGNARGFLFLGRGAQYPIALEGALKLKEISYIHAEGYAAGEMKHGPIALIDEELPVVCLVPRGPTYDKVVSNLAEVRARQGKVVAIATRGDVDIGGTADEVVLIPDTAVELQPILTVLPLQLLAYYVADFKGTDIDQPRNLAKSVTVE
ncbi:MAG: glutamine--fructose-6-phosphate transaminase (isomerizing) [Planctomycetes bacterium]|nr:glutamine--fructose-6-phosphate transaminase (isomerizing) [Myxococcales bacterium]MCB9572577.1 glutamine--fructose-6-phosphate transaminase (isomerizing) [Kofleriaceae bacterium]MCB9830252.1 glutamine--fructose-6-phosphate transaminase (isomerizing) [Planctomycetota bacterium]